MDKNKVQAMIPVDRIIGVTELRYQFKDVFESIKTGLPFLVWRGRKNNLVIITEEEYIKFTEYQQTLKK